MTVGRICTRITYLADAEESVHVAAGRMRDLSVGTLVVIDADGRPEGLLTDRDLVTRVIADGRDPAATKVGEVMSRHPRVVHERAPVAGALELMRGLGVRRLPVVDLEGRVIGILSVDDVLELVAEEVANLGSIVACHPPEVGPPAVGTTFPRPPSRHRAPSRA
jgi:CBS domain-containing protein